MHSTSPRFVRLSESRRAFVADRVRQALKFADNAHAALRDALERCEDADALRLSVAAGRLAEAQEQLRRVKARGEAAK